MIGFRKKKKDLSFVALDIGTQYVKIAEITQVGQAYKLKHYKILNLVSDGKRLLGKEISKLIKKSFSDMAVTARFVRTSVSGKSLVVRHVELPKMTQAELKSSLRYQADLHIPFNLDEAFYDAHILTDGGKASENKMKVVIVAIKRKDAEEVVDIVKKAGLMLDVITVDSIAIYNAFVNGLTDAEKNETVALIDIGASKTNIHVVDKGASMLCREIKYGGIQFTEMLIEGLNLGFDQAEEKKLAGDDAILPFAAEAYKPLIRDIRTSFDYFEGIIGVSLQKLYLSGGGAFARGLPDYLKEKLGIPVVLWNPLRKIDDSEITDKDKEFLISHSSFLSVCLGIGLTSSPEGK